MPLDFQTKIITIPEGTGTRTINDLVIFNSTVRKADIAVKGFRLDYTDADHHINIVEIDTAIRRIDGATVNFTMQIQYADKNYDDEYKGHIKVLVIADVE